MESLGNNDISPLNAPKYQMVRDGVRQKMTEGTPWFADFVTVIVKSYFKTLLHYMCSVPFCGEALLKEIEKTLKFSSLCLILLPQIGIINSLIMEAKS